MKWMIASDIHGSAKWCARMVEAWQAQRPERLILLGDLLYHGPRNDLPEEYAPKKVIALLNDMASELLCVRGNCEAEVDQMVLSFPVMADYAALLMDGHVIYMTHGHTHGEDNPPPLKDGDILLCGHTHVPCVRRHEDFVFVNPGSVAIPKDGSRHSYCILEDGELRFIDLATGEVYDTQRLWNDPSDPDAPEAAQADLAARKAVIKQKISQAVVKHRINPEHMGFRFRIGACRREANVSGCVLIRDRWYGYATDANMNTVYTGPFSDEGAAAFCIRRLPLSVQDMSLYGYKGEDANYRTFDGKAAVLAALDAAEEAQAQPEAARQSAGTD